MVLARQRVVSALMSRDSSDTLLIRRTGSKKAVFAMVVFVAIVVVVLVYGTVLVPIMDTTEDSVLSLVSSMAVVMSGGSSSSLSLSLLSSTPPAAQGLRGSGLLLLNPLFSLKPLTKSLHGKWKLWDEMTPDEQEAALDEVGQYLSKYGRMMGVSKSKLHGTCTMDEEIGTTGHKVCGPKPTGGPCTFVSFGINDDPSWDREVASLWGCRGFAGDPTVQHPSKLHDKVTFHNIGASIYAHEE